MEMKSFLEITLPISILLLQKMGMFQAKEVTWFTWYPPYYKRVTKPHQAYGSWFSLPDSFYYDCLGFGVNKYKEIFPKSNGKWVGIRFLK